MPGIRAIPNYGAETTNKGKNSAILRYAGATIADPTTIDTSGKYPLNETDLHVRPFLFTGNATLCWGSVFFAAIGGNSCGEEPRLSVTKAIWNNFCFSPETINVGAQIITSFCISTWWVYALSIIGNSWSSPASPSLQAHLK
jgi:hypothetical protein